MNELSEFDSRRSGGVWRVLNSFLIVAIILALCVAGTLAFIPIAKERHVETSRIEQLQAEIAKQKALLARRTREAQLLKNDPAYVELVARDRLDVMKPGETIIRLEPGHPATQAPTVPPKN